MAILYHSACASWYNKRDNGPFKSWYSSGQLEIEGTMKDGMRDGEWRFYHLNGKLFKKVIYRNDLAEGSVIEYYDNGNKKFEGNYL